MAVTKPTNGSTKFQEVRLAKDMLGYIIEQVEEKSPKNLNWIGEASRGLNKAWIFTIKHQSDYFPDCIKKYVHRTKKMVLEGTLYDIEKELTQIWEDKRNTSL